MHNNTILNSCSKHFCVQFFPYLNYQLIKLMMMHQQMHHHENVGGDLEFIGARLWIRDSDEVRNNQSCRARGSCEKSRSRVRPERGIDQLPFPPLPSVPYPRPRRGSCRACARVRREGSRARALPALTLRNAHAQDGAQTMWFYFTSFFLLF